MARSTAYYHRRERAVKLDEVLAQRIKHVIAEEPYLGYRMVWAQLRREGRVRSRH